MVGLHGLEKETEEMKTFNEKHEVIIHSEWYPIKSTIDIVAGTAIPHRRTVHGAYFYMTRYTRDEEVTQKVYLSKAAILDISTQIRELETEVADQEWFPNPF